MTAPNPQAIIRAARRRRWRSPARAWIEEHYDEIDREPLSLDELAKQMGAAGILDANKRQPSASLVAVWLARARAARARTVAGV